jgi:outer membrane protein OmpA-like peptidoglycan-associated protein
LSFVGNFDAILFSNRIQHPTIMKRITHFLFLFILILLAAIPAFAQKDFEGSSDHPLITRYPGAYIGWYDQQAFETYKIALGPVTGYRHIDDWMEVEGKLTRIYYVVKGSNTITEIFRNYMSAIEKAGFETLVKGIESGSNVGKDIGGNSWMRTAYAANPLPSNGLIKLLDGSATSEGSCYLAAKLSRPEGDVYLALGGHTYSSEEKVFQLDIIETIPMEDDLIKADADFMAKSLDEKGYVTLYGLLFDFDKAELKPESDETLSEMAKLLKNRLDLNAFIVGHTDMKGQLNYNMTLSLNRSKAVVDALVDRYGIDRSRLEAHGVGPLVPVSTNKTDNGRSKNRRVELVAR